MNALATLREVLMSSVAVSTYPVIEGANARVWLAYRDRGPTPYEAAWRYRQAMLMEGK